MTTPTSTSRNTRTEPTAFGAEDFSTSEGLRALLIRLHEGGEDAWVHDPVARDLMEFAADKYRALARKHKLDTWEAVAAAFDAMQYRSTREANDPWAIITHAVRITCVYEERAQGLLCSVHQARRAHVSAFHDPERFSDRDTALADYHPAFHTTDLRPSDLEPEPRDSLGSAQACMSAGSAAEDAIAMLCLLDWPTDTARAAVEHVCGALMKAGTRQSAYEALRRDRHARAILFVRARVPKIRDHRRNTFGRSPYERVHHNEQLHQVLVARGTRRLDDKNVVAAYILIDLKVELPIRERRRYRLPEIASEIAADLFRKCGMCVACEYLYPSGYAHNSSCIVMLERSQNKNGQPL